MYIFGERIEAALVWWNQGFITHANLQTKGKTMPKTPTEAEIIITLLKEIRDLLSQIANPRQ
jgi:hypothetical protein